MEFVRPKLDEDALEKIIPDLIANMKKALAKHGYGATLSTHEALGDLREEETELVLAIIANDKKHTRAELLDVAVSALWSIASMDAGYMDH